MRNGSFRGKAPRHLCCLTAAGLKHGRGEDLMNPILRSLPDSFGFSALLCTVFVTLAITLGSEIYRCDILGIPGCD